jgi:hypothetical protein
MKRKHTTQSSANRSSGYGSYRGNGHSIIRFEKRFGLHEKPKKTFGYQVKRVQSIKMEKHKGLRVEIKIKFVSHAS